MTNIILCVGSGTRLWPLSRTLMPKQFVKLFEIGRDVDITIKKIVGFKGELYFNTDKHDGSMKKLTDVSRLHGLGWKHTVELKSGIEKMYQWYQESN